MPDLRRDFMGRLVCATCWRGEHYVHKTTKEGKKTSIWIPACLQGGCECLCTTMVEEHNAKWQRYKVRA